MKRIYQVLTSAAVLVASGDADLEKGVVQGPIFGGPHGRKYTDVMLTEPGQTVESISIRSAARVDSVSLEVTNPRGVYVPLGHGGNGGEKNTLYLREGEHVIGMTVHWGKHHGKTRIMYIYFDTNRGRTISGGTPQDNSDRVATDNAMEGYQLGGFEGTSGDELDSIGAIWTSIKPVE
ncbi:hypothetical protein PHMEG_00027186 [Phytophthora megakarya]|uniref:Jacalin-type lectin domain-containing protein n=1 Tax=Phytophthora megakarya TaxID=4795 RepID=A0A225V6C9_9STRA|nr:hypothetical protein PHMEG_00027186 [Phytophthora megakarya]